MSHDRATLEGTTAFLVAEARAVEWSALPEGAVELATQCALDWFAVALAGSREPLAEILRAEAREQGAKPVCSLVGHADRTSPHHAALINGSAADAVDFSDVHLTTHGHLTASIMAASLACAEACGATGRGLLTAFVAGTQLECRLGLLANPELYTETGFHPTAVLSPFGAAAAAAHLMKLDESQWAHALGLAATQAAGLKASRGTLAKPFHAGASAAAGLMAARLARRGFLARPDAIEAGEGFLATHTPEVHPQLMRSTDGWLLRDTLCKRYAACTMTHATIENVETLRDAHGLKPSDVETIALDVHPGHTRNCNNWEPVTGLEAKFSLRATAALALMGEDLGALATYDDERIRRADLTTVRDRVQVTGRDDMPFSVSTATLTLKDGRKLTATTDMGRPVRDLAERRRTVTKKFFGLAEPVIGRGRAEALHERIVKLADAASVRALFDATR